MGAPPEVLEQIRSRASSHDAELWEEHEEAFAVFCAARTQWEVIPLGMAGARERGLNYAGLKVVVEDMLCVPPQRRVDVYAHVRIMERAVLNELWSEMK